MTKANAPERIHHWLNTQLSIARHYGGIRYNGEEYVIAYNEEGQPLVRADLLKKKKSSKRGCPTCAGVDPKSCMRCYGKTKLSDWETDSHP
jgi:hypothetical protein